MLGLPRSTAFNKRIPKQKFYENMAVTPALKKLFVEQVKTIYWRNKLAATTTNLAAGQAVTELEVFEIHLNQPTLDESVLRQIDREIPYHILFLLEYDGRYKAVIAYKQVTASGAGQVGRYYATPWLPAGELPLKLDGLNLDAVYENFVRQTRGTAAGEPWCAELPLGQAIALDEKRQRLQKQITALQNKIRREKQLNRQVELNAELKRLMKELE